MSKKRKPEKNSQKEIRIECEGSEVVGIHDVTPMQGELKTLTPENHERFRKELIRGGFSEPLVLWKQNGTQYVIGGHQRVTVLLALEAEGYTVPPVPACFVEAKDEREAREKLLGLASQYGQVDEDGLEAFLKKAKVQTEDAAERFRFIEVNVELLGIAPGELPQPDLRGADDRSGSLVVAYETVAERDRIADMLGIDKDKIVHRIDGD